MRKLRFSRVERSRGNNCRRFQMSHAISRRWRSALTRYGRDWKRGRKVTSNNSTIFLHCMPNNRFLSQFSQYVSISRVFNAWRMADHFAANSLFPPLPLSPCMALSSTPVSFFLAELPSLSIFISLSRILPVLFHPPFLSRIPGSFIFFANYFLPTLLISSSRVYTLRVHHGQGGGLNCTNE